MLLAAAALSCEPLRPSSAAVAEANRPRAERAAGRCPRTRLAGYHALRQRIVLTKRQATAEKHRGGGRKGPKEARSGFSEVAIMLLSAIKAVCDIQDEI
eukprot:6211385-Pleurochrysis_carterae.AAC.3